MAEGNMLLYDSGHGLWKPLPPGCELWFGHKHVHMFLNYLGLGVVLKAAKVIDSGKGPSCSPSESVLRFLDEWGNDSALAMMSWVGGTAGPRDHGCVLPGLSLLIGASTGSPRVLTKSHRTRCEVSYPLSTRSTEGWPVPPVDALHACEQLPFSGIRWSSGFQREAPATGWIIITFRGFREHHVPRASRQTQSIGVSGRGPHLSGLNICQGIPGPPAGWAVGLPHLPFRRSTCHLGSTAGTTGTRPVMRHIVDGGTRLKISNMGSWPSDRTVIDCLPW